ncbi:MAG: 7-cyano-7-deazaguanine synthase QueC, partial [Chloroflexota bacterium]|nr:7-cyano-7-deazaguanine synthase QueC [Chloroflexota bacterium]
MIRKTCAVVTLSGGVDSATILYLAMQECDEVHAISINYGQCHIKELEYAKKLCELNNVKHTIIPFDLTVFGGSPLTDVNMEIPAQAASKQATTVVPYRNTFIAMIAAAYCKANNCNIIYMGPTYEDLENYEDCRPIFFDALQKLVLVAGTVHDLEIRTPFITTTKQQIIQFGQTLQVPYENTWTCYAGKDKPCMTCDACRERMQAFRANNMRDPLIPEDVWA